MHTDTDTNYSVTITAHTAEAALAACAWLDEHRPDWRNPAAYWTDEEA